MGNNKFIIIDKKAGESSFKSLSYIKKKYNTKKVGHCGTLDPFATGLLIIGVNQYTKLINLLNNSTKTYSGIIKLGSQTDTFDSEGKIINSAKIPNINNDDIKKIIDKYFTGNVQQIPPKYSAIKVNGKKLYEYARENKNVKIKSRNIEIYNFNCLIKNDEISFNIKVSSGTYIRSIANDLAIHLETFGHLTKLRRTHINNVNINMVKELITEIDVEKIIDHKILEVNEYQYTDLIHGKKIKLNCNDQIILAKYKNKIISILAKEEKYYKVQRGMFDENN